MSLLIMNKGIQSILIASFCFSIINALVKYLEGIPSIQIVFFRSIVSLVITYFFIRRKKLKIFNRYSHLLFLRGICGAIALTLYFYTIQNMPLATSVTILYMAPIFTVLFAIVLLKEKPHPMQWPFILLSFVGVALMKNFDPRISMTYLAYGVIAAIFAGLAYNFIRMLKGKVDPNLVIFYFPLITIPFCLPWLYSDWVQPNLKEFILLLSIGILTQIAQFFMTKAYMLEEASKISHFNYLTSFWAFITGIIFFNEHLSFLSIIGLSLIFIGIFFSARYSQKA